MTTGEKLTLLRKEKNITQEQLAEILNVSRQSVSRWEQDAAFPETDKLIQLSRLFSCSIDFLLSNDRYEENSQPSPSVTDYCKFIRDCGYFFLATSVDDQPRLRPFGMILSNERALFMATDKRKTYIPIMEDMMNTYPALKQKYQNETEMFLAIFKLLINDISIT